MLHRIDQETDSNLSYGPSSPRIPILRGLISPEVEGTNKRQ